MLRPSLLAQILGLRAEFRTIEAVEKRVKRWTLQGRECSFAPLRMTSDREAGPLLSTPGLRSFHASPHTHAPTVDCCNLVSGAVWCGGGRGSQKLLGLGHMG